MKRNIIIFLNSTFLSHTQLIQERFLLNLSKKFNLFLISSYNLDKIKFLSKIPHKKINYQFKDKNKLYYLIREINLNTTLNKKHNFTITDFSKIYINNKLNNGAINFFFIFIYKALQNLLQVKIILTLFQKLQSLLFYDKKLLDILKNINPKIILTSSPGWWEDDNILLFTSKKINTKTISIISSWDQPTGMGLMPFECNYYLVWSNQMKDDLIKFHKVEPKKIKIFGAIHWDHYFKKYQKKKNNSKKLITIFLKSPTRTNQREVINFCNLLSKTKLEKNFNIIVRPHPLYYSARYFKNLLDLKTYFLNFDNLIIQDLFMIKDVKKNFIKDKKNLEISFLVNNEEKGKELSIKTIINSDVIINFFSTANIEASILNTPTINFIYSKKLIRENLLSKKNLNMDKSQNHIQNITNFRSSDTCTSFEELRLKINECIKNPNIRSNERKKFIKYVVDNKGNSIKKISDFIKNI